MIFSLAMVLLGVGASFADGWTRTYGGSDYDEGYSVAQTTDGGYIVAGRTFSFGAGGSDVYLVKTDALGDTIWTRTYGGSDYDWGRSVAQTTDGGYIVAGATWSFGAGSGDVYLVKTDALGDTIWTRTYGGTSYDWGYSVAQTTDGGYIVAGETGSFGTGGDVYLVKANSSGDTLWTRAYGGTSYDWGYSVAQTTDGGYIIAGETYSFGAGSGDVYLVKTDALGDTIWTRTYGGSYDDWGNSVAQTSDGGYIVAGLTTSFGAGWDDVYLVKTDALGDTIWTRTYETDSSGWSVAQTTDGGYIVAGGTYSFGAGNFDVYLVKTDALGDTIWTRTYGGSNSDWGRSVAQTTDGGYVVAGVYDYDYSAGTGDVYLIKTDSLGYSAINEPAAQKPIALSLTAFPNPFNSSCVIAAPAGAEIEIYDLLGNRLWSKTIPRSAPANLVWKPEENIASGVYIVRATARNRSATKQVVYLK